MIIYGNSSRSIKDAAKVETDMVAFCVHEDEVEDVSEYLISAIIARCLLEFGEAPEIS